MSQLPTLVFFLFFFVIFVIFGQAITHIQFRLPSKKKMPPSIIYEANGVNGSKSGIATRLIQSILVLSPFGLVN